MSPAPGERLTRFVGDRLVFTLESRVAGMTAPEFSAFLRTNLGRGGRLRHEIIHAHTGKLGLAASAWRDIPMRWKDGRWEVELALTEVGFFKAKAYLVDENYRQHWPDGPDAGIGIHPDHARTGNTIYCAFVRMFGHTKTATETRDARLEKALGALDEQGYTVIPPSGTFRDLIAVLPHIIDDLGCRLLHLLPVNPVPTTYARFGRFGSPYACQDLLAIDPALVQFDKRTTGVDQFRELTYATHLKGGRVFLDVVINHTGWGSTLQERHPEWFVQEPKGNFASPGAWGVVWEDLVELHHRNPALWEYLGDVFLEWCRRGVDGFRCDAGYKIPVPAWRYITARVLEAYPETIFLLEGLGGSWAVTEELLTEGGMQWAYSELFQNYGTSVAGYLDYSLRQSHRVGLYVNYSETHDNDRLAKEGRSWSLLRNRLCALASVRGGFGFTCGVEWMAKEKLEVHQSRGLSWGNKESLIPELAQLNRLLLDHPCFFDGATLSRLSEADAPVLALSRVAADGLDHVLVLINTDPQKAQAVSIAAKAYRALGEPSLDLLTAKTVKGLPADAGQVLFHLEAGACHCLAVTELPRGLRGESYRRARAQSAWAVSAISHQLACEDIGPYDWRELAAYVSKDPGAFLAAIAHLDRERSRAHLIEALNEAAGKSAWPKVTRWQPSDVNRVALIPPAHWLLIEDAVPFRASLKVGATEIHVASVVVERGHVAGVPPSLGVGDGTLSLERFGPGNPVVIAPIRVLACEPDVSSLEMNPEPVAQGSEGPHRTGLVLLTNGRGGMARMQVDLGKVESKYDCVLGANLHPTLPVDRHIFVKRIRVWVVAEGFINALNGDNLIGICPGPPAEWRFVAGAGDCHAVEIRLTVDMLPGKNSTVLIFHRPEQPPAFGRQLPAHARVSLTVRPDILDRNFHCETRRNGGAEYHFSANTHADPDRRGFLFTPAADRQLRVHASDGLFHPSSEWSDGVEHSVEQSRGQVDREDAWSPGWFELPMAPGAETVLSFSAELEPDMANVPFVKESMNRRRRLAAHAMDRSEVPPTDAFGRQLALAVQAFVARRGEDKTVIAGYPWFLDWGRDSLICARGLLAAGMIDEVRQLLLTFGRFAQYGTIPNSIHGEDASNRDTSDAPLWYGLVAEELAKLLGPSFYDTKVDERGRTIREVLIEIASGYRDGTPNGIRMDAASGLIWSPSHFTWMDTNHPAATPREGYPIEIQALWIRLCRQLARLHPETHREPWVALADRATQSLHNLYWLEESGWFSDLLVAGPGTPAASAVIDDALRSNFLIPISLGLIADAKARRAVNAAVHYLVVPGALRSLAPLPVSPPLPVRGAQGQLLNTPDRPYQGRYEGEEDTRRKPAYHNGTAWTWTFPVFCEALARAWNFEADAVAAARAYLGSMDRLLTQGCLGQLPEIVDGDAPHQERGCDAQAWGATEALRVWKLLGTKV